MIYVYNDSYSTIPFDVVSLFRRYNALYKTKYSNKSHRINHSRNNVNVIETIKSTNIKLVRIWSRSTHTRTISSRDVNRLN